MSVFSISSSAQVLADLRGPVSRWAQDNNQLLVPRVAPSLRVVENSGRALVLPPEEWSRVEETRRAAGADPMRVGYRLDGIEYECVEHVAEHVLDDQIRAKFRSQMDFDEAGARLVLSKIMLKAEVELAAILENDTLIPPSGATGETLGTAWTDPTTATPIADIDRRVEAARGALGRIPDAILIPSTAITLMDAAEEFQDRMKHTVSLDSRARPADFLRTYFGFREVFVSTARKNTADLGQAQSTTPIMSRNYVYLLYLNASDDLGASPQTFRKAVFEGNRAEHQVERDRHPNNLGDRFRAFDTRDIVYFGGAFIQKIKGVNP